VLPVRRFSRIEERKTDMKKIIFGLAFLLSSSVSADFEFVSYGWPVVETKSVVSSDSQSIEARSLTWSASPAIGMSMTKSGLFIIIR
jgi:hypothetical protein